MSINYQKSARTLIDNEIIEITGDEKEVQISSPHHTQTFPICPQDIPKLVDLLNAYYYINYLNPPKEEVEII